MKPGWLESKNETKKLFIPTGDYDDVECTSKQKNAHGETASWKEGWLYGMDASKMQLYLLRVLNNEGTVQVGLERSDFQAWKATSMEDMSMFWEWKQSWLEMETWVYVGCE